MIKQELVGQLAYQKKKKLVNIQLQIAENQSGWSAKQVMNFIYEKSGVKYHEVHVYRLLHK